MRGRSTSKAMRLKFPLRPELSVINGLEKITGSEWNSASWKGFLNEPGQVLFRYGTPSKSVSLSRQPPMCSKPNAAANPGSTHPPNAPSSSPAFLSLPVTDVHAPNSWSTELQYSKCPISSENAMLYV